MSRAVRDKIAEDDRQIADLERKLGLKSGRRSGKLPKSFWEDGLADLLGVDEDLDGSVGERKKRKLEEEEWLARKRKNATTTTDQGVRNASPSEELVDDSAGRDRSTSGDTNDEAVSADEMEESSAETASPRETELTAKTTAVAVLSKDAVNPVIWKDVTGRVEDTNFLNAASDLPSSTTYVPPKFRGAGEAQPESTSHVRRITLGLINRLSEMALISITQHFEKLYRAYPSDLVTSTSIELLMKRVCQPSALDETELLLAAGFVAAIHRAIGQGFAAEVMRRFVAVFGHEYGKALSAQSGSQPPAKETTNLVTFLCGLYNFQVVGNELVFDYITMLLSVFSELNSELLLRIFRMSGPQLRRDNPTALKDVVDTLGPATANAGLSVRTKFMIDTLHDLKNNKASKTDISTFRRVSERLKRINDNLGTLRAKKPTESLHFRLSITDSKAEITGAAAPVTEFRQPAADAANSASESGHDQAYDDGSVSDEDVLFPNAKKIQQLAREQGMTTVTRQAIFVALVGAADDREGYSRVLKLHLNKKQRADIVFVLMHCVAAEEPYNPYYTLVAKRFCKDHSMRHSFQYGLWRFLKRLGEDIFGEGADDDDVGSGVGLHAVVGVARMFGTLTGCSLLGLSILKCLNLVRLQKSTRNLIEILLLTVFRESFLLADGAVERIFAGPGITKEFANGLHYFLRHVMEKTDLVKDKLESRKIKRACLAAEKALTNNVLGALGD